MGLIRDWKALLRSWRIYHSNPAQDRVMDALYARFIKPGDLVFDVGAHIGHRTASFLRLGARVVAVEPQREAARFIRLLYGLRGKVTVVQAICGRQVGTATLHVNADNPLVSTASDAFIASAQGADGWREQRWDERVTSPMTTVDALRAQHGAPAFIKIDVEGFEADVLAGLNEAPPALSFEFTLIQRDEAYACMARCAQIGLTRFNASIGESHVLAFADPVDSATLRAWIAGLPASANSGDIYAIRPTP